jgi:hypothetical protein
LDGDEGVFDDFGLYGFFKLPSVVNQVPRFFTSDRIARIPLMHYVGAGDGLKFIEGIQDNAFIVSVFASAVHDDTYSPNGITRYVSIYLPQCQFN